LRLLLLLDVGNLFVNVCCDTKKGVREDDAKEQAPPQDATSQTAPTVSSTPAAAAATATVTGEKESGVEKYAYEEATAPSRGNLIRDFLIGGEDARQFMEQTQREAERYNGFSLLLFELQSDLACFFLNNVERQVWSILFLAGENQANKLFSIFTERSEN